MIGSEALATRDVHDEHRGARQPGQRNGAVRGLPFRKGRPRRGVMPGLGVPCRQQPAGLPRDGVAVLRVHEDDGPEAGGGGEDVEHLAVGQLQRLVGHVDLQRRAALRDQIRQVLAQHGLGGIRHDEMEPVVDEGPALGRAVIAGHDVAQALSPVLRGKGHHGRRPSAGRRHAAREEVVGRHESARRSLGDVAVRVDAAGHDEAAGRVDLPAARPEALAQRRDAPVAHADVEAPRLGVGHHRAAANDKIESLRHGLRCSARASR